MFKLQVQDDVDNPASWHDVLAPDGTLLTFTREDDARRKLEELFPVMVKAERYGAMQKRTRVIAILTDEDDWPKKKK
jgi:tRNA U34 5-methylaminomethyl-2-thiouridine-forming methyltransferase MnmC